MDIDECEAAVKAKTAAPLSINKSSGSKISKSSSSSMRRPMLQPSKPLPTSKVYNTDPMSFRELVQQLTGNSSTGTSGGGGGGSDVGGGGGGGGGGSLQQQTSTGFSEQAMNPGMMGVSSQQQYHHHHYQQQQQHQQQPSLVVVSDPAALVSSPGTGGGVLSPHSSARPVNSRLQRMAPPPLRPTFSISPFAHKLAQHQQQHQQQQLSGPSSGEIHATTTGHSAATSNVVSSENLTSPGAQPLSPLSNKRVSTMPLLSFSPLPVLSPSDTAWASFESPNTAAMKQLAQSIIDGSSKGSGFAGSRFPWSPTFQGCLGLPSPGLPVPELFPEVKMIDSPENARKTAATAASSTGNDFSFPEIRES
ncbi:hypothetical protein SELMODRAFT_410083 [Selaginella moellendorffii]|uniref:VQ domain-containing protein n=1 Tax=Selaginella moellendorffii TaxID=88036 RepID=D8RDF1_SELML|nr:hypothetical protein SELMODRAFT_410083 [Selaginella moellendorffii]